MRRNFTDNSINGQNLTYYCRTSETGRWWCGQLLGQTNVWPIHMENGAWKSISRCQAKFTKSARCTYCGSLKV